MAVERERHALGLADLERAEVVAQSQARDQARDVLAHDRRGRHGAAVLHLEQLHPFEVEDRVQAGDLFAYGFEPSCARYQTSHQPTRRSR